MKPKVLIVEDEKSWQHTFTALLGNKVEVLLAPTIQDAEKLFQEHRSDLAAILMDAQVMASFPNTMDLIREFRRFYKGPMIAMSSLPKNITILMDAGCDYGVTKGEVVKRCLRYLASSDWNTCPGSIYHGGALPFTKHCSSQSELFIVLLPLFS
jgi:CheY-like chemotaxis protein